MKDLSTGTIGQVKLKVKSAGKCGGTDKWRMKDQIMGQVMVNGKGVRFIVGISQLGHAIHLSLFQVNTTKFTVKILQSGKC